MDAAKIHPFASPAGIVLVAMLASVASFAADSLPETYPDDDAQQDSVNPVLDSVNPVESPPRAAQEAAEPPYLVWNRGVEQFNAGDHSNAYVTLRPLALERTHAKRVAEVLGAVEFERGMAALEGDDPAAAERLLSEAARDFQRAAEDAEPDSREIRNLSRATERLELASSQARSRAVAQRYGSTPPDALAKSVDAQTLALMRDYESAMAAPPAEAVRRLDSLEKRAADLADASAALTEAVRSAAVNVTNEQQAARLGSLLEGLKASSADAAGKVEEFDADALSALSAAENAAFELKLAFADPPEAIAASRLATTNAMSGAATENSREWKSVAPAWTASFSGKFPQWIEQYEQQAQADTNYVPMTAEAKAEIVDLAKKVLDEQLAGDVQSFTNTIAKIDRIRELMPQNKQQPPPPEQQQQQQQNQQQNQNQDQQNQEQNQDQDQQNQDQNHDQQQDQEQQQEQSGEDDQQQQQQPEPSKPEEVQAAENLIRQALDRNEKHEDEKRARLLQARPSPNERDW